MITIHHFTCPEYLRHRGYLIDGEPAASGRLWSVAEIQRRVAEHYGLPARIMKGHSRYREHSRPRQVAMYLAKHFTAKSLPQLGEMFDRDHTTVIHGVRRIELLRVTDPDIAASVEYLSAELQA